MLLRRGLVSLDPTQQIQVPLKLMGQKTTQSLATPIEDETVDQGSLPQILYIQRLINPQRHTTLLNSTQYYLKYSTITRLDLTKRRLMAYSDSVFYYMKNVKLVPDTYGMTIEIKMLSAHKGDGTFIKNLKLDEDALKIIKEGVIVYNEEKK